MLRAVSQVARFGAAVRVAARRRDQAPNRAASTTAAAADLLLQAARPGPYNSIALDARACGDAGTAALGLGAAVASWRARGKAAVWLTLSFDDGALLAAAGRAGFTFHHAEGTDAVLLAWLPTTRSAVPPYATHQVGAAGVAVDAQRRLLVVQDVGKARVWKFPGGMVERGEDFGEAAVRETREETGVRCAFRSVLALRHSVSVAPWGKGDVYVLCRLEPLTAEITADAVEIAACEWMDGEAFVAQAASHPLNRFAARAALDDWDAARSSGGASPSLGTIAEEDVLFPSVGRRARVYFAAAAAAAPVAARS